MSKRVDDATKAIVAVRKRAYEAVWRTKDGQILLEDLAKFCRATESTFHPDARVHALQEGRREVWLRIQQHLKLTDEDAWALYTGVALRPDVTKSLATVTSTQEETE